MTGDVDLDALRDELADFAEPAAEVARSSVEERVLAGFEEIRRWVTENGRLPRDAEGADIFERLYTIRLERIRAQEALRSLVEPFDEEGILKKDIGRISVDLSTISNSELAAELAGIGGTEPEITTLRHVRSRAEIQAAEEIATRQPCADFERFEPLFKTIQDEIKAGIRSTRRFGRDATVAAGHYFILRGQVVYVAKMDEVYRTPEGPDARLRLIYSNGTESNLLMRSLQNALYKDENGRRITEADAGPLFAVHAEDDDLPNGTVYVLRSNSDHPDIATRRDLIHKIGVTRGEVPRRIANAKLDPTYLLADVEVVTTYQLYHINQTKLENLLHRVFDSARLEITLTDRFGNPVSPREWFLVPLFVIDEAIERIKDGTITHFRYEPATASLVRIR